MSAIENYQKARAEAQKAIEAAREVCKSAFCDGIRELIAENPEIQKISWRQYTPYFNDGDECVFSVHEPYINGFDAYGWNEDDEEADEKPGKELFERVDAFFGLFEESDMKFTFGDHVRVTATAEGIEVEEYSHD